MGEGIKIPKLDFGVGGSRWLSALKRHHQGEYNPDNVKNPKWSTVAGIRIPAATKMAIAYFDMQPKQMLVPDLPWDMWFNPENKMRFFIKMDINHRAMYREKFVIQYEIFLRPEIKIGNTLIYFPTQIIEPFMAVWRDESTDFEPFKIIFKTKREEDETIF